MSKKFGVSQSFIEAMKLVHGIKDDVKAIMEETTDTAEVVEEEEQIDELKSSTLRSYSKKVDDKIDDIEAEGDYQNHFGDSEYARKKTFPKAAKHRAMKSLANMKLKRRERDAEEAEHEAKIARNKVTEDTEYEYIFVDSREGIVESLDMDESKVELMFAEGVEIISAEDIIVEDVEELEELNKTTLRSYVQGAEASVAATKKKGKPSKVVVALRTKRGKGMETAKAKLRAILDKEHEEHKKVAAGLHADLTKHWDDNHHQVLEKHGYKLAATGTQTKDYGNKESTHIKTYIHAHDHGHVSLISIHHKPGDTMGYTHDVRATNSKGTSWGTHTPIKSVWDEKDHKKQKEQMIPGFESHVIKVKNETSSHGSW